MSHQKTLYQQYRLDYLNSVGANRSAPIDISLELSSVCNMNCTYCLDPATPVLMSDMKWKAIADLKEGDSIVGFDEFNPDGGKNTNRKMKLAFIEKVWDTKKEAVLISTTHGDITCSLDHKFLDGTGRWTEARNLKPGRKILFGVEPWEPIDIDSLDYMRGYLEAMTIGDGTARWKPLEGATGNAKDSRRQIWWRIALIDNEPLDRILKYFRILNIQNPGIKDFTKSNDGYQDIHKIEIRSAKSVGDLFSFIFDQNILDQASYEKGYLAGIFDAEGSTGGGCLRISQKQENDVCDRTMLYLSNLGFESVREEAGVRLLGGKWEKIRFFGLTNCAIKRKQDFWHDESVTHKKATIVSIEPLGEQKLVDITTSTRTFYGAGFATHNCYHSDKANLPFKQKWMKPETFREIILAAYEANVRSVKTNWRGESTLNPHFETMTALVKDLAIRDIFIDRLTNSNFKFANDRDDIFRGLANQTKVKVSYDSFRKDVFEAQRAGGDHALTTANIDKFYNWPGRETQIVIQAVRTSKNADEDLEGACRKRWPSAQVSIRDMVEGRVDKDLSQIKHKERDFSERQSCIQAHARLIFDWDGTAMPCCPDIRGSLALGNIRSMSLHEIFNCEKAKRLRSDLISGEAFKSDPCKNCSSFETFKGYVPAFDS